MTRLLRGTGNGAEVRTSESHPLRVDFPDEQPWKGRLGITFAPGKNNESYHHFRWCRDLGADLDRLRSLYRVDTVLSLVEQDEIEWMGIPDLRAEIGARGMESLWFPIPDLGVPPGDRILDFMDLAGSVIQRLEEGKTVVVHCRGGLGRAGMVAACLLAMKGITPRQAIRIVRAARGESAVEMPDQEDFVDEVASLV